MGACIMPLEVRNLDWPTLISIITILMAIFVIGSWMGRAIGYRIASSSMRVTSKMLTTQLDFNNKLWELLNELYQIKKNDEDVYEAIRKKFDIPVDDR